MKNRSEQIAQLKNQAFDCLIIGGGASGAGCALDSTLRGYKTALIDKADFAAATSSRSTKLIHGGVRYLEQAITRLDFGQLAQVRHGLKERHLLLKNAPHLAQPLPLITPVFSWLEGLYFMIGLKLYGWFADQKDTLPASEWLGKKELFKRMPRLSRRIHSGVLYYDGQLDDARYCLSILQTAANAGASLANYTELEGFEKNNDGKIEAVRVRDMQTGECFTIRAKVIINCTLAFTAILYGNWLTQR
ncbi:MAG: FAD-dependent oxidoreductase [Saprospiraceae bacterium]